MESKLTPYCCYAAAALTFLQIMQNSSISVYSLTDDKILSLSKLKALADNNFSAAQMVQIYRVKNMIGKGENTGHQHFLFSPQVFQNAVIE